MRIFSGTLLLAIALASGSVCADCPHDLAQAREIPVPPASDRASRALWDYAANYSKLEWQVHLDGQRICARLDEQVSGQRPKFVPQADGFRGASSFARVDDGWLVGFNQGEFGAALYWFSENGRQHYRISEHQVVQFFPTTSGWGAIEGLAHLGMSEGSIILVTRAQPQGRWQARTALSLPAAPYAIAQPKLGPALAVLSDSLVAVTDLRRADMLLADAPWAGLYPNSAVLSADERTLYI
ncbi:MAG TPA: hypothetical protein VIN58_24975, partial [Roseateles sp.]